ncbi:transposase [Pseudidiomarina halophila]|uniref:transposase n=2 Tax=Pseudidiomarina halophila TaxID=1449799 RepID=UPI0035ECD2DE
MSKGKRYTEEFKVEAVKQVTERGHSVYDVADRLGISVKSLYDWRAKYGQDNKTNQSSDEQLRIAKLEAELKRVKEERDILKKAAKYFAGESE